MIFFRQRAEAVRPRPLSSFLPTFNSRGHHFPFLCIYFAWMKKSHILEVCIFFIFPHVPREERLNKHHPQYFPLCMPGFAKQDGLGDIREKVNIINSVWYFSSACAVFFLFFFFFTRMQFFSVSNTAADGSVQSSIVTVSLLSPLMFKLLIHKCNTAPKRK